MVAVKLAERRERLSRVECAAILAHWYSEADDGRHIEVINGEYNMVPGNFPHGFGSAVLARLLGNFIDDNDLGILIQPPFSVIIREDFITEPDLIFIRKARLGIIQMHCISEPPDLVVEILSPSTKSYDRNEKFEEYGSFGIPELWLVDPIMKAIEIYTNSGNCFVLRGKFIAQDSVDSEVLVGLSFPAAKIFPEFLVRA